MTQTPLHDWLAPRMHALFAEALTAGFTAEAVAAVMIDIATTPPIDTAAPPSPPHGNTDATGD